MSRTTVLQFEMTKSRQGVNYLKVIKHASGHKLRIKIYSDSYRFQCYAFIEVFHPEKLAWNEVARIPYASMKTPEGLCYEPCIRTCASIPLTFQTHFNVDADSLIKMAKDILE